MVVVTERIRGFLALLALAATRDEGFRGNGKRAERGEWSQTKVDLSD